MIIAACPCAQVGVIRILGYLSYVSKRWWAEEKMAHYHSPWWGTFLRVTCSTVVCGSHFTASDFSTGRRQGSSEKIASECIAKMQRGAVPSVFSFKTPVWHRPLPKVRGPISKQLSSRTCSELQQLRNALAKSNAVLDSALEQTQNYDVKYCCMLSLSSLKLSIVDRRKKGHLT